jgi:dihydrodipicolinate synthase/N-acetylneuraminate lyase
MKGNSPVSIEPEGWRGVFVATALPYKEDFSVDYDAYAEHITWLAANGCDGACPNGSLGEYTSLTPAERTKVVETAIAAAPKGFRVMPGTGAYGAFESRRWAEQAAEAGASSVLQLPPNAYRADARVILEHYREIAKVGIPVVAYNNPLDTKVHLTAELLAQMYDEGLIVAVKDFSGDVRNIYQIHELAPGLDVLIGSDDVVLELGIAGAAGWIAGYPNAIPSASVELYQLATSGEPDKWAKALSIYKDLHSLLRWDSKTEFVQAIKLSMDVAGRNGGRCRPPRLELLPDIAATITRDTEAALAKGYK